jgi:hypothetical protein
MGPRLSIWSLPFFLYVGILRFDPRREHSSVPTVISALAVARSGAVKDGASSAPPHGGTL